MNWRDDMNPLLNSLVTDGGTEENRWHDFHSDITIQFGELIESGFDWGRNEYYQNSAFTDENRERLNKKIEDHYYYREICEVPPGKFRLFLIRKLNEIMPKYNELYKIIDEGKFNVLRKETNNGKSRNVFSEYPQSQLQGNADYATNASDNANASTSDGPVIDMMVTYQEKYNDVDLMIIKELDVCFLSLLSLNVNGF